MGLPVLLYGKSGTGKSRSLLNFGEDEIFLINVQGKRLPCKKKFKYVKVTHDYNTIKAGLMRMPTKAAVIDDAGYLMTHTFMNGHSAPRSGSSSFDLYNDIADQVWGLVNFITSELPDDVIVYITMHEETSDYGNTKLLTIGKLLDQKVCLEGMFTVVLRCMTDGTRHYFRTQSDGFDISKSPEGMFEREIDNDLKAVDSIIRDYWDLNPINNITTSKEEENK